MEQPIPVLSRSFKDCTNCKKKDVIPLSDRRVTCHRCRDHSRRSRERKRQNEREKALLLHSSNKDEIGGATSLGGMSLEPKKKKKHAIGVGPPDLPSPRKKVVIYAFTARTEV